MIAYLILVHRYPGQFKRLFKAIYDPRHHYLIHVDKNSGPDIAAEIADFIAPYQGAAMLKGRKAMWGGYSLVDAELRGMAQLLEMNANWTHFINLSGQDFPLKSQSYIRDYLAARPGTEFIRVLNQKAIRPDTMHRIRNFCFEALGRIFRTPFTRRFLQGVTPYIGTQWMIVSRQFCEFVCHAPEAERYKSFYRNSFIADEGFFQTVMMNSPRTGKIVTNDLRMIDWVPDGDIKLRPRTFVMKDAKRLTAAGDLFARKFDMTEDSAILDLLERHIRAPEYARASPVIPALAAVSRRLVASTGETAAA